MTRTVGEICEELHEICVEQLGNDYRDMQHQQAKVSQALFTEYIIALKPEEGTIPKWFRGVELVVDETL